METRWRGEGRKDDMKLARRGCESGQIERTRRDRNRGIKLRRDKMKSKAKGRERLAREKERRGHEPCYPPSFLQPRQQQRRCGGSTTPRKDAALDMLGYWHILRRACPS